VDIDLEKFFDTVNHDKLMTIVGRIIKDGDVISIVRKFLVSGVMIDDEYEDSVIGTPQGGNISPLLANIMLNELDKEMEARGLDLSDMQMTALSWSEVTGSKQSNEEHLEIH
jgi:retron-type reverse transcriptase